MANFNFNKVILGGRLTADPELKTTPSGVSVTSFTVAVNRRYQAKESGESQADFINVTAWRQTAEFVTRFFRKASSICIVGSIQTRRLLRKKLRNTPRIQRFPKLLLFYKMMNKFVVWPDAFLLH